MTASRKREIGVVIGSGLVTIALLVLLGPSHVNLALVLPVLVMGPPVIWLCVAKWFDAKQSMHVRASATWVVIGMLTGLGTMPLMKKWPLAFAVALAILSVICALGCAMSVPRRLKAQTDPLMSRQVIVDTIQMWLASFLLALIWLVYRSSQTLMPAWLVTVASLALCGLLAVVWVSTARDPDPALRRVGQGAMAVLLGEFAMLACLLNELPLWPPQIVSVCGWVLLTASLGAYRFVPMAETSWAESERAGIRSLGGINVGLFMAISASLIAPHQPWIVVVLLFLTVASQAARERTQVDRTGKIVAEQVRNASLDPLTEIPNRRALSRWVDAYAGSATGATSVITIDLDGFKDVNDLLGHSVGDDVLRAVGQALLTTLEGKDATAYRMGGDEFTVIAAGQSADIEALAEQLITAIDGATARIDGVARLRVTASAGVSHIDADSRTGLSDLITRAGHAMRAAKVAGKGRVHVFDQSLLEGYQRRKLVEMRLRERIPDVVLHYQPIIAVSHPGHYKVMAYEALARWEDDQLGIVDPLEFVAVAEGTGLIQDLGQHLLRRALVEMDQSGLLAGERRLSVNVSALQLRTASFVGDVLEALAETGVASSRLTLEVTESNEIEPDGPSTRTLGRLAAAGIALAIDDFGAGHTSVSYLSRLPINQVKLDRSLTDSVGLPGPTGIIRGLVEMCRGLRLSVVLEGVETPEQEMLATELGIDRLQGWLYGLPVPIEQLVELTARIESSAVGHPTLGDTVRAVGRPLPRRHPSRRQELTAAQGASAPPSGGPG